MHRRDGELKKKVYSVISVVVLGSLILGGSVHAAEQEEFPEGMTEEEKQQMLDEMYEDINSDSDYDEENAIAPGDAMEGNEEGNEELPDFNSMSDEEIEETLRKSLPTEEEAAKLAESLGEQVQKIANYRTSYDTNKKLYRYVIAGSDGISISVPIGGWTEYSVALVPDDGMVISSVVKDGTDVTYSHDASGGYLFREAGVYSFIAHGQSSADGVISGNFRILNPTVPVTGSFIWTPEGYILKEAFHDGTKQAIAETKYFEFREDGVFELVYEPKSDLRKILPEYSFKVSRDTTPPVIEFDGEIQNGRFSGTVTYSVPDPHTEVHIYFNGQEAVSPTHELAAAGNYFITATDLSGNVRSYNFTVLRSGKIPWKAVFIALLAALIMALFVVFNSKYSMKVKQNFDR